VVVCSAGKLRTVMMRADDFRRMALALGGASEGAHMGHPDFRVNNRIFATLHSAGRFGMVALTPEQQREFLVRHPSTFTPEAGAWGRAGSTRVHLASAEEDVVGEALTVAWQNASRKGSANPSRRRGTRKHGTAIIGCAWHAIQPTARIDAAAAAARR